MPIFREIIFSHHKMDWILLNFNIRTDVFIAEKLNKKQHTPNLKVRTSIKKGHIILKHKKVITVTHNNHQTIKIQPES